MSAPVAPMDPVDAAEKLFDALALLAVLDGRLDQLANDGELTNELACELSRVLRLCSAQVDPVASVVVDWKLSTGSAA